MQKKQTAQQLVDYAYSMLSVLYDSKGKPMRKADYLIQAKQIARSEVSLLIEHGNLSLEDYAYWRRVSDEIDNCRP
jgi:hypothetical protein